jgi:hypothetical protein
MLNDREKQNVTAMCVELHMHATGSADYMSRSAIDERIEFLKDKLVFWKPPVPMRCSEFDFAVKGLIRATLAEWEAKANGTA